LFPLVEQLDLLDAWRLLVDQLQQIKLGLILDLLLLLGFLRERAHNAQSDHQNPCYQTLTFAPHYSPPSRGS
jgi:hypothetical protein